MAIEANDPAQGDAPARDQGEGAAARAPTGADPVENPPRQNSPGGRAAEGSDDSAAAKATTRKRKSDAGPTRAPADAEPSAQASSGDGPAPGPRRRKARESAAPAAGLSRKRSAPAAQAASEAPVADLPPRAAPRRKTAGVTVAASTGSTRGAGAAGRDDASESVAEAPTRRRPRATAKPGAEGARAKTPAKRAATRPAGRAAPDEKSAATAKAAPARLRARPTATPAAAAKPAAEKKRAPRGRDLEQAGGQEAAKPKVSAAARSKEAAAATKAESKRWSPFSAYAKGAERLLVRMRPEKIVTAQQVVEEIRKGPQGPKVVAAFDFDGTLVSGLTGAMLMQERMRRKEVSFQEITETAGVTFRAMAKLLEANEVVAHSMAQWAGKTEEEMEELGAHLFEHKIQDAVFPEMRQIIAAHREAGHSIVVATSASRFQVEPTVKSLGIDKLVCTQVEVAEGKLTGKLVGDSVFGAGKVAAIKNFVAEHGGTLADTYFYADGDEEVGLMEAIGYPHPVNPGRRLSEAARSQGWPVLRLQSRGSARPGHFVRGIAGMMTILPILQAGLAVGLLTRDKRHAANLIMPTWIQTQLDLAGVKLRVSGRKNLWARRPAVFIFNHRNNYDGSFVASLVRTDYVSIAKKDMAKNPVGKLVAAIMPTVFIDRGQGTSQKAAETLQPVVEAVDKGYSIMLAPEGTRVRGNPDSVGPFKKGAFHMAMAAGIPVVPVVIRNALDVVSRDGGAMRPGTVDIAVLPPVSVEDWDRKNLDKHVEEVRQMFIDTLRNWPEPDEDEIEE